MFGSDRRLSYPTEYKTGLPLDVAIEADDVDATSQGSEFSGCRNTTTFALLFLEYNFGIGEKSRNVSKPLSRTHSDRLLAVHEDEVTSALILVANARWVLRVETYETEAELVDTLGQFAAGIMHRERRGDLDQLD